MLFSISSGRKHNFLQPILSEKGIIFLKLIRNALQEFYEGPVIELPNPFQGSVSIMQKLVKAWFLCDGEIHFVGLGI